MSLGDEAGVKAAEKLSDTADRIMRFITALKNGNKIVLTHTTILTVEPREPEAKEKT